MLKQKISAASKEKAPVHNRVIKPLCQKQFEKSFIKVLFLELLTTINRRLELRQVQTLEAEQAIL